MNWLVSVFDRVWPPPCLPHHAAGVGRRVGAVEHWSRHLRLLPHQRHGGEDPRAGERPLHPPVCDGGPGGGPPAARHLHTVEKTLKRRLCGRSHVQDVPREVGHPMGLEDSETSLLLFWVCLCDFGCKTNTSQGHFALWPLKKWCHYLNVCW